MMTFFYNLFREREREREREKREDFLFIILMNYFNKLSVLSMRIRGSDFKRREKMNYIQENIMMMMRRGHY